MTVNFSVENKETRGIQNRKRLLAQVLASSANSWMFLCVGAATSYPTVLVAGLSDGEDAIKISESQLSWIGSVSFVFQAIGCIAGGLIVNPLGRKKAMIVVNLPHIAAWIMLWLVSELGTLFTANALLGLGTGLMKAPITSYLGEICEPSIRGVLITYSSIFTGFGVCVAYIFGTMLPFRTVAAVFLALPVIGILVITMIPESPIWLLSKGRNEEALKSLCWLRGWADPSTPSVLTEFEVLIQYNGTNMKCNKCQDDIKENYATTCVHRDENFLQKIKIYGQDLAQRDAWRPLLLICLFFMFTTFSSITAIKPNMVNIFKAFNVSIEAHWATVGTGVLVIIGALICMSLVKFTGKRPLALTSLAGSSIFTCLLAYYAQQYVAHDVSTFREVTVDGQPSTAALLLFLGMLLCNYVGLLPIGWTLVSEIFPYKARGALCGLAASFNYIVYFITVKTYYNLESYLHICGAFYFYAGFNFAGLFCLYLLMPETENRTPEEIQAKFGSRQLIFADDVIARRIKESLRNKTEKSKDLPHTENEMDGIYYTCSSNQTKNNN